MGDNEVKPTIKIEPEDNGFPCEYLNSNLGIKLEPAEDVTQEPEENYPLEFVDIPIKLENEANKSDATFSVKIKKRKRTPKKKGQNVFSCKICQKILKSEIYLKKHLDKIHLNPTKNIKKEKEMESICHICQKVVKDKHNLKKHIKYVHESKPEDWFYCTFCPYKTAIMANYKRHELNSHMPEDIETDSICPICQKVVRDKYNLKKHIKYVHERKPEDWFHCKFCAYKTTIRANYKRHELNSHMPEDQINWKECSFCSYKGKQKSDLRRHIEGMHMESSTVKVQYGKHQCTECPFRAKELTRLNDHMKRHYATEGSQCSHCSYRCKTMSKLFAHEKIHDVPQNNEFVENFFECPYCAHKTIRKTNLINHIKIMHTDSKEPVWYSCDWCNYGTKQKARISAHVKKVHEDRGVCNEQQEIGCEVIMDAGKSDTVSVESKNIL